MEQHPVNRRRFLKAASAVSVLSVVPRRVLGGPRFVAPSEQVNVALIGAGGQGRTNVRALFGESSARVVAVADPTEQFGLDEFYYKGMAGRKPVKAEIEKKYQAEAPGYRCAEYEDFRVMLEKEKGIDAVLIATPDHLHAYVSVMAMRMGKHVYCEKPLTHCVAEARRVAQVAKETGVATQMGNQGHSGDGIRMTCEWIWDGAIGAIREVHSWSTAGKWFPHVGRPKEAMPVPAGMNWDLWLGTREPRPFHSSYSPVRWRSYWDFGTASLGDMACHNLDPAVWALNLRAPLTVEASACDMDAVTAPVGGIYRWQFGVRGDLPPVKLVWYDGGLLPERPAAVPDGEPLGASGNGILFLGEKGVIVCPGWAGRPQLYPAALEDSYKKPAPTIPRVKGHHRDWLEACKGGKAASGHFEYSAALTELVLLGNVALRASGKIHWDAAKMEVTNDPKANALLRDSYRQGWEVA